MSEPSAAERPARPFGAGFISWPKWLGVQLLGGIILVALITLAMRPLLEGWAVRALGQGTMFMAGLVDWSRWREIRWPGFAGFAAAMYGGSFLVWYLLPD